MIRPGAVLPDELDDCYAAAGEADDKAREAWEAEFAEQYRRDHAGATDAEIAAAMADEIDALDNDPRSMGWVDDRGRP